MRERNALDVIGRHRQRLLFALAVTAPLAVAAALVPWRTNFTNAGAALILVAVIVALSLGGTRVTGFVASVFAALWFDYFLTRPYDHLTISHRPDLETTVCLLVVGLMVSELAARRRHHLRVAGEEGNYVAMVRELTDLAQTSSDTVLVDRAQSMLIEVLDLRACRFDPRPSEPPMARIMTNGDVHHVGMRWPAEQLGIPGPEAEIAARWRGRALGRFVLTPTPGDPISQERRAVAALLATVVAAGLANARQGV
jgi:K+-sensing histidine kinase KdpD